MFQIYCNNKPPLGRYIFWILLLFGGLRLSSSCIWGIDVIKKINSMDVDKVREDRSKLIMMEGHGAVIQHLPAIESPFSSPRHLLKIAEKEYPDPWRHPRPQKRIAPIPSGAIAVATETENLEIRLPTKQQSRVFLFTDIANRVPSETQLEE